MRRRLLPALALVLLAGCQPAASPAPVSPPSSSSATPTAPSAPSAPVETPEPSPLPVPAPQPPLPAPVPPAPVTAGCAAPTVCITADSTAQLKITRPGTYDGQNHSVPNILIQSSDVVVRNFRVINGRQAGIWAEGDRVRIERNDISQISFGEDDLDAIRFFGNDVAIVGNRAHQLIKGPLNGAHPDFCQTWTSSSHPAGSSNVLIQGNVADGFDFHQGVTAEGLNAGGNRGGTGLTAHWRILDNRFEGTSNQTIVLRGVTDFEIVGNVFAGHINKAVQVAEGSRDIRFSGNVIPVGAQLSGG